MMTLNTQGILILYTCYYAEIKSFGFFKIVDSYDDVLRGLSTSGYIIV